MYKKVLTIFIVLFLVGCGGAQLDENGYVVFVTAEAVTGTSYSVLSSPTVGVTSTPTVSPTVTVDWQGTAIIAQQTADEARRLNTVATAEFEERVQEQIQMTAVHEARVFESNGWTATAALTSVPATQTQQAILNTQIVAQQTLDAGQLTAVKEAPTQMVAMTDAENYAQYWLLDFGVRMFAFFGMGVFMIGVGVFTFRARPRAVVSTQAEVNNEARASSAGETVIWLKRDNGSGLASDELLKIPCSPEQLTEFAEGIVSGEIKEGINNWEGADTSLTREVYKKMREYFVLKLLAFQVGDRVILNADGRNVLRGWLESRKLPDGFVFEQHAESVN